MAKKKKKIWPYIVLALLVLLLLWAFFGRKKQERRIAVAVEAAEKRNIIEMVPASGKVFPTVEVELASIVSGTIVELLVAEGDEVQEGQLIGRVDPDALASMVDRAEAATGTARAQLESARAQKMQVEAQFVNTKLVYERSKQLFEDGVIARSEYDAALASFETAKANILAAERNIEAAAFAVKSSEATVKEQRKNLSQTRIYAPMNGIVSKLYKKQGEQVVGTAQMAGTPILKIANLNSVEVRVDVNERDILTVSMGDTAEIELNAYPGKQILGIVSQLANTANNLSAMQLTSDQVTNFEVRILLLQSSYRDMLDEKGRSPFRAGMSASAKIRTKSLKDVLTVAAGSVTARPDKSKKTEKTGGQAPMQEYVFVVEADTVRMLPVQSGIQDESYLQIVEGVEPGQVLVKAPFEAVSNKLQEGDKVEVLSEEELYKKGAEQRY